MLRAWSETYSAIGLPLFELWGRWRVQFAPEQRIHPFTADRSGCTADNNNGAQSPQKSANPAEQQTTAAGRTIMRDQKSQ